MTRSLRTEVEIAAGAARVWSVLTDFVAYPEWAPFFQSIEGEARVGARLVVKFQKGPTVRPVVTEAVPEKVLEWHGKVALSALLGARHRFELHVEGDRTRLVHSERFSGLLVFLLGKTLRETEQGFHDFNKALRQRAET